MKRTNRTGLENLMYAMTLEAAFQEAVYYGLREFPHAARTLRNYAVLAGVTASYASRLRARANAEVYRHRFPSAA